MRKLKLINDYRQEVVHYYSKFDLFKDVEALRKTFLEKYVKEAMAQGLPTGGHDNKTQYKMMGFLLDQVIRANHELGKWLIGIKTTQNER